MWLLKCLKPDHNTISNFRRDNPRAIKKVFRATIQIAKHFDLIGGKLIAGDSTKLRAQNSKKNNFNQFKIDRHIACIDNKTHIPVPKARYCKQTDHGTNSVQVLVISTGLSSTRQRHAEIVRSSYNAPDQKRKG
jgi:hypothetical protein